MRSLIFGLFSVFLLLAFRGKSQNISTGPQVRDTLVLPVDPKKNKVIAFPVVNYTPETSLVLGVSGLYTFYFSKKDTIGRPSFLFGTGIYTLKEHIISALYLNTWSKENKYHYVLNAGYTRFNYNYYGVGNNTLLSNERRLKEDKIDMSLAVERKITNRIYGGLEYYYRNENFIPRDGGETLDTTVAGYSGGIISLFGASLIYDTRNHFTSTTKGNYYKLTYLPSMELLGSHFSYYKVLFESRNFYTMKENHTLGFNSNIETIQGDRPFFDMRQMGGPFIMRGYFLGRYRHQNYIAGQVEYRYKLGDHFRLVAFAGTGQVFENDYFAVKEFKMNVGGGIRFVLDPAARINLRIDYGFGEKPPGETRIQGLYLYVGEAF